MYVSALVISLDFELHWGGFEKWPLGVASRQLPVSGYLPPATYDRYFLNTRKVIPQMLALFEKYNVHVTWAGVGMLMHANRKDLERNMPVVRPTYVVQELSAYHYINRLGIGENEEDDPFHYGHSLVKQIVGTPHQELGSHTFGHYYCNEAGQTVEQFRADLQAAQRAAAAYGVTLRSLVFPRNQFNDAYLKVCYEEGFVCVRSNPRDWFWNINSTQNESLWKRLNRGLDAYLPIGNRNTYSLSSLEVREGYPVCLPASRLLRPYHPKELFLNRLKVNRIKAEMHRAAIHNEVYHLWWHPHNFGNYPYQSLEALEEILKAFNKNNNQYGMQSLSLNEITRMLFNLRNPSMFN